MAAYPIEPPSAHYSTFQDDGEADLGVTDLETDLEIGLALALLEYEPP